MTERSSLIQQDMITLVGALWTLHNTSNTKHNTTSNQSSGGGGGAREEGIRTGYTTDRYDGISGQCI